MFCPINWLKVAYWRMKELTFATIITMKSQETMTLSINTISIKMACTRTMSRYRNCSYTTQFMVSRANQLTCKQICKTRKNMNTRISYVIQWIDILIIIITIEPMELNWPTSFRTNFPNTIHCNLKEYYQKWVDHCIRGKMLKLTRPDGPNSVPKSTL